MTKDEILSRVQDILETDFQITRERVKESATFRGTLGMDSLDAVDFIYLVGKAFQIPAEVSTFSTIDTVGALVQHVEAERAKKQEGA